MGFVIVLHPMTQVLLHMKLQNKRKLWEKNIKNDGVIKRMRVGELNKRREAVTH